MKDLESTVQTPEEKSFIEDLGLDKDLIDTSVETEETQETEETEETTEKETETKEETEETKKTETEKTKNDEETEKESQDEDVDVEKDLTPEEVNKLPKDAKGIYYALKKEREKRKEIEGELQFVKLHNKYKSEVVEKKAEEKEEKFETVEDILKDRPDDELLTVGEQRRIETAKKKEAEFNKNKIKVEEEKLEKEQKKIVEKVSEIELAFKATHSDYDEMFNIYRKVVQEFPSLHHEIMSEAYRENGNPAKKVYEIGKKFKSVYGGTKSVNGKPNEIERIIKNAEKKVPSASITGGDVGVKGVEEYEGMDDEELRDALSKMSMQKFMTVPRKLRIRATGG